MVHVYLSFQNPLFLVKNELVHSFIKHNNLRRLLISIQMSTLSSKCNMISQTTTYASIIPPPLQKQNKKPKPKQKNPKIPGLTR